MSADDRCGSYVRHPVEDIEPPVPTVAEQVRDVCCLFAGEILRMPMIERDIVCRRVLGETWAAIAEALALRSPQAAEVKFRRATADRPAIRRFFESTTNQEPNHE